MDRFLFFGVLESASDLGDDTVLWEIEELFEDQRGQDLADRFFRRQRAGAGPQIEVMLLPDLGTEPQGDQLQQPLGDQGAEDEDFIGLPAGGDGGLVFGRWGLQGPIRGRTAGVARQVRGPEVKTKRAEEIFQDGEQDFNAGADTIQFERGDRREGQIGTHQDPGTTRGDGENEQEGVAERFPQ